MKGFGIHIKNDLLDSKHIEQMGVSVWLYMWLIDKMTSISEKGVGKVLGGKPIKYHADIAPELGISESTYNRWVEQLKKHGYINVSRAPHGLIMSVNKAVKVFGQKAPNSDPSKVTEQNESSVKSDGSKRTVKSDGSNIRQYSLDNTIDRQIDTDVATDVAKEERFKELLAGFKTVNPSYRKFFANTTERKALKELVEQYGFDKMENLLRMLPDIVQKPYAPRITSPYSLQRKMGELIIFMKQEQGKGVNHGKTNIAYVGKPLDT